jgi:hypothetical protein
MRRRLNWGRTSEVSCSCRFSTTREARTISVSDLWGGADPRTGLAFSFLHDRRPGGFHDAEIELLHSTLLNCALAMKITPAMISPPDFCGLILA